MKELSKILKSISLVPLSYRTNNNIIEIDTTKGRYIAKKNKHKENIYDYLNNRNFNYYPKIVDDSDYLITEYIEDSSIPNEKRMFDLVELDALLHAKTTYYRETKPDEYKQIYEDVANNFIYLKEYYTDMITIIDSKVFMSPSEYLLARNISLIFESINKGIKMADEWIKQVENEYKIRVSVVHNNLRLSHLIESDKNYLVSWDKSKIDIPIFDLYNLYNIHYIDYPFNELLKDYEKIYPLKKYERELLFILLIMPKKIEFSKGQYEMTKIIGDEIDRLYKSNMIISEYKKSIKN